MPRKYALRHCDADGAVKITGKKITHMGNNVTATAMKGVMDTETKLVKTIAHGVFLFWFAYAAFFFFEIMTLDTSFLIFKIICYDTFSIQASRYAAFVTQIIPLAFINLNFGLKTILISYSVSFVLVFYVIFLICLYVLSSLRAGIAATFVTFLGISETSLYAGTEIHFGMMSAVLFYGFLEYYFLNEIKFSLLKKYFFILLGALIILFNLFNHPSTLFPVFFTLTFQMIDKKLYKNETIYVLAVVAIVAYGLKYLSIDTNSY